MSSHPYGLSGNLSGGSVRSDPTPARRSASRALMQSGEFLSVPGSFAQPFISLALKVGSWPYSSTVCAARSGAGAQETVLKIVTTSPKRNRQTCAPGRNRMIKPSRQPQRRERAQAPHACHNLLARTLTPRPFLRLGGLIQHVQFRALVLEHPVL